MSQTKILVIFGVVVSLAIGGYVFVSSRKTVTPVAQTPTAQGIAVGEPNPSAPVSSGKKIPFADFIKQGGSYRCNVSQSVQGVDSKGVTYIDGKMVRGEYTTNTQGMSISSSLIVRDGYTYSWTGVAPSMGFKSKIVERAGDTSAPTSASYSFNTEQIGEYDCQPWTIDATMFAIPTGMTWREM